MSDYLDRTVGLGYIKSSIALFIGVLVILFIWHRVTGKIEFENITTKKEEVFYWLTILVSNTLGTALGDFVATDTGIGFELGALVFGGLIALVVTHKTANRPNVNRQKLRFIFKTPPRFKFSLFLLGVSHHAIAT